MKIIIIAFNGYDLPKLIIVIFFMIFEAETWFAVLFTVMVEVVPTDVRSIVIAIFLFLMNNIGGQVFTYFIH